MRKTRYGSRCVMEPANRLNQIIRKYTVRPFFKPARADYKDAFRIYLAPAALLLHQLRAGDPCDIWIDGCSKQTAIAWPAPEKIQDTVVQTSKTLQNTYGFRLGDRISLTKRESLIPDSILVSLKDAEPEVGWQGSTDIHANVFDESDNAGWEWFLSYPLGSYLLFASWKPPATPQYHHRVLKYQKERQNILLLVWYSKI
jgi:AAA family ATPase